MKNNLLNKVKTGYKIGLIALAGAISGGCASYEVCPGEAWQSNYSYASLRKRADEGNNIGISVKKKERDNKKQEPYFKNW